LRDGRSVTFAPKRFRGLPSEFLPELYARDFCRHPTEPSPEFLPLLSDQLCRVHSEVRSGAEAEVRSRAGEQKRTEEPEVRMRDARAFAVDDLRLAGSADEADVWLFGVLPAAEVARAVHEGNHLDRRFSQPIHQAVPAYEEFADGGVIEFRHDAAPFGERAASRTSRTKVAA
jgi:hypothetical protein